MIVASEHVDTWVLIGCTLGVTQVPETNFNMNNTLLLDKILRRCPDRLRKLLCSSLLRTASDSCADSMVLSSDRVEMFTSLRRIAKHGYVPNIVIDVGAHEGMFSKKVLQIFPDAKCVMFEGNPDKLNLLSLFVSTEPSRLSLHGVLLGPTTDTVNFHVMKYETGSSVLLERSKLPYRTIQLDQVRLSDVLGSDSRPSIIKLDVQGYESQVIKGIDTDHLPDFFLCELSLLPLNDGVPDFEYMIRLFADMGYVLYDICGITRRPLDAATWQIDGLFIRRDAELRSRLVTGIDES